MLACVLKYEHVRTRITSLENQPLLFSRLPLGVQLPALAASLSPVQLGAVAFRPASLPGAACLGIDRD